MLNCDESQNTVLKETTNTKCHIVSHTMGLCVGKIQNRWIHRNKEKADWGLPEPRGQEDGGCFKGMKILHRIMRFSMLVHTCHLRTQEEAKAGDLRLKASLRHLGRPWLKQWVDRLIQYLHSEDWMVGKHLSLLPIIRPFVPIRAEFWIYNKNTTIYDIKEPGICGVSGSCSWVPCGARVCLEPGLLWCCATQHAWELLETAWIHHGFLLNLSWYVFRNLLLLTFFSPPPPLSSAIPVEWWPTV